MPNLEVLTRFSKEMALKFGEFIRANTTSVWIVLYLVLWFLLVRYDLSEVSRLGRVIIVYSIVPICLLYLFHRW